QSGFVSGLHDGVDGAVAQQFAGGDIISSDGEGVFVNGKDRVGRRPGLVLFCNEVLLSYFQLIELGAGGGVGLQIHGAFGIDNGSANHIAVDDIAVVLLLILGVSFVVVLVVSSVLFAVAAQLIGAGIGVVMTLEYYVDVILVHE